MTKARLHTHTGVQRDNSRWGSPNNTLPGYFHAYHRGHQPIKGVCPQARGVQGYNAKQGPKSKTPKKQTPCLRPPPDPKLSTKAFTPLYRCDTHHHKPSGAAFGITFWTKGEFLPSSVGHVIERRGKAFWDCTGLIMGYLGDQPKEGKGKDLGDLGRSKCRKIEG